MKKVFQVLIALITVVVLASCGKSNSPEVIAESFLNHLNQKEYAEAKKLGTESTQQMIAFLESFPSEDEVEELQIQDMKCEVNGDSATCTYVENGMEASVSLIKKDKKWLVDMPKEMPDESFSFEGEDEEIVEESEVVEEETVEVLD